MMIVVFGHEIEMVDKSHGGLQTGLRNGAWKYGPVQFFDTLKQAFPRGAEVSENLSR
jgi:hypothetical protein